MKKESNIVAVRKTSYRTDKGEEGRTYLATYRETPMRPRRRIRIFKNGEKLPETVKNFILAAGGKKTEMLNEKHLGGWVVYRKDTYTADPTET